MKYETIQYSCIMGMSTPSSNVVKISASSSYRPARAGVWTPTTTIGKEVKWRPLLLYANPLGHHSPATLKIHKKSSKGLVKTYTRYGRGAMGGAMGGPHSAYVSLR